MTIFLLYFFALFRAWQHNFALYGKGQQNMYMYTEVFHIGLFFI